MPINEKNYIALIFTFLPTDISKYFAQSFIFDEYFLKIQAFLKKRWGGTAKCDLVWVTDHSLV